MLELTLDTNLENIAVVGAGYQDSKDMVLATGAFTRLCQAEREFLWAVLKLCVNFKFGI
jgi:hypothetical protein